LRSELFIYLKSLTEWNEILKSRVAIYDENRKLLVLESELWAETKINADTQNAPEAIIEQIISINTGIEELK